VNFVPTSIGYGYGSCGVAMVVEVEGSLDLQPQPPLLLPGLSSLQVASLPLSLRLFADSKLRAASRPDERR
jgi:hypothetical protein